MINMMERILDKLDVIDSRLNAMDKTLIKQEQNLAEHMKRSDMLEKKLEPVEKHVYYVQGSIKLIGILSILAGIYKAFHS